ncbi:MAG: nucleotidyltransferase family protein [Microcoleus vaginatus WJT46-NPBG5]|nr:nucleotidyltransferase family protein [Microcoleus vaginatus WJT46-NPBG5]
MKRDEVIAILAAHKDELKALGVKSLELFGSVARDEAGPDSDVDFLLEFENEDLIGLFEFSKVRFYLEDSLGCSVDIGTRKELRKELQERVIKEAIRAY